MKTDSEKLQRLIDIAWDNGMKLEGAYRCQYYLDDRGMITSYTWPISIETVIFYHDFIKALCRAKFGKSVDEPNGFGSGAWELEIKMLALSSNRIHYLWEVFGNDMG